MTSLKAAHSCFSVYVIVSSNMVPFFNFLICGPTNTPSLIFASDITEELMTLLDFLFLNWI